MALRIILQAADATGWTVASPGVYGAAFTEARRLLCCAVSWIVDSGFFIGN